MNRVYTDYIRKAKKRNIPFNLLREYFYELIKKPCYYCGVEESNHMGKLAYNGIDRKDNKLDYSKENCVTCCKECNRIKSNILSDKEMLIVAQALNKYRLSLLDFCEEVIQE